MPKQAKHVYNLKLLSYSNRMNFFLLVFTGVVLAKTDPSSLGQGFYLPEKDILGKFYDGASIFDTIEKRCVKVAKTRDTDRQNRYFKSNENFYKYLSSKTGIDGQYKGSFTMKTTLDITTKSISDSTHQVSLYMLDIYALKDTMFFAKNCQNTLPFSKAFLADFHKLPVQIKDINRKDYWLPYESFLKKYGSHIVNEINRGSRLRQWMFASSTEKYTERDFNVRACLELSKNTDSLGVKACSGITSKEKKSVEKMTMRNARHLRGGKPKTTAKLAEKGSPELIEKFLVEAQKSPGDVLYKFTAIWDLLQERYLGSNDDDLARSLNLEACYSAVLDLKCTRPSDDKVSLKWLEPDKKSKLPTFSCKIAALGCQKDSDCHIGGAASVCYCYGSSCVDKKEVMSLIFSYCLLISFFVDK